MINLLIFGAPGAGKGTQAKLLVARYGFVHVSTGDILRAEIANQTPIGIQIKQIIAGGNFVPDELMFEMLEQNMMARRNKQGFLLDGFPRTLKQIELLDKMFERMNMKLDGMVAIRVMKEELIRRLQERGKESGRPDDQDLQVIENRIQIYINQTMPLIHYYRSIDKLFEIKGTKTIESVFSEICAVVENLVTPIELI